MNPKSLDDIFGEPVPDYFADFFRGLVCLSPAQRWTASVAMKHLAGLIAAAGEQQGVSPVPLAASVASGSSGPLAVATSATLPGAVASAGVSPQPMHLVREGDTTTFQGHRGPFALREGYLAADVLQRLESGISDEGWSWAKKQTPDRSVEFGNKLEICGHVSSLAKRPGLSLNGRDAEKPLAPHVVAFALALKSANVVAISSLESRIRNRILELKQNKVHVGDNGAELLAVAASSWAWDVAALQVMKSSDRDDPVHFDGGASFLHAGITIRGKRTLFCRHGSPASPEQKGCPDRTDALADSSEGGAVRWPELPVPAAPGHVYIGCLCGPEHYVQHHQVADHDLFPSWLGPVEITILLRSRVFRQARGSTQAVGPVPKKLWQALAPVVSVALEEELWRLPDLVACEAELAKLKG